MCEINPFLCPLHTVRVKRDVRTHRESFHVKEMLKWIEVTSSSYSAISHRSISRSGNFLQLSSKYWQRKLVLWGPPGPQVVR